MIEIIIRVKIKKLLNLNLNSILTEICFWAKKNNIRASKNILNNQTNAGILMQNV